MGKSYKYRVYHQAIDRRLGWLIGPCSAGLFYGAQEQLWPDNSNDIYRIQIHGCSIWIRLGSTYNKLYCKGGGYSFYIRIKNQRK